MTDCFHLFARWQKLLTAPIAAIGFLVSFVAASAQSASAQAQPMPSDLPSALRAQIETCWTPPDKAPPTSPRVSIELNADGALVGQPKLTNPSNDPAFKAFEESAVRAVVKCAPFKLDKAQLAKYAGTPIILNFAREDEPAAIPNPATQSADTASPGAVKPQAAEPVTVPSVDAGFESNGQLFRTLTLVKTQPDGRAGTAVFVCGFGETAGEYAVGVNFDVGEKWKTPQQVVIELGSSRRAYKMIPVKETIVFESSAAKSFIRKLARTKGPLTFEGPDNLVVSVSLDDAPDEIEEFKGLCSL